MKRLLAILIGVILLSGCSKKWCQENYPCIDSTYIKEAVKFDTTYIKLPADTTYLELPFDCQDQQIIYKEGKKEYIVKIKDKILYINQITKDDSLRIINLFKNSEEFKQAVKDVEKPIPYIPEIVWYTLAALIGLLIFAYRKKILVLIKMLF